MALLACALPRLVLMSRLRMHLYKEQIRRRLRRELDRLVGAGSGPRQIRLFGIAMLRLERGDYGRCAKCGQPINPVRLKVMPASGTCSSCQTTIDRSHSG